MAIQTEIRRANQQDYIKYRLSRKSVLGRHRDPWHKITETKLSDSVGAIEDKLSERKNAISKQFQENKNLKTKLSANGKK